MQPPGPECPWGRLTTVCLCQARPITNVVSPREEEVQGSLITLSWEQSGMAGPLLEPNVPWGCES